MTHNHIVLYQPVMPANTGNIARTCAATNATLHLIKPLGFSTEDKMLKRAGLDYWQHVEVIYHDSLADFLLVVGDSPLFVISKFAQQVYSDIDFNQKSSGHQYLLFGSETHGLPTEFIEVHGSETFRIPMRNDYVRALNLSNAVNIVLYEALRQQSFPDLNCTYSCEND